MNSASFEEKQTILGNAEKLEESSMFIGRLFAVVQRKKKSLWQFVKNHNNEDTHASLRHDALYLSDVK